jgi:purine nucleosidase
LELCIDTDMGADDALAIALALRSAASVSVISTVSGNVSAEQAAVNLRVLLSAALPEARSSNMPPLVVGATNPLTRSSIRATSVFGSDGMGGVTRLVGDSGGLLYRQAEVPLRRETVWECWSALESPSAGRTLVTLGPLTNLAQAVLNDRELISRFDSIVMMGGALHRRGNITPYAEFNVFADPEAAAVVFQMCAGMRLIPLDITTGVDLQEDFLRDAAINGEGLGRFMYRAHGEFLQWNLRARGVAACHPHDAIAVLAALHPEEFEFDTAMVSVELDTEARNYGQTKISTNGYGPIEVCVGVRHGFVDEKIAELFRLNRWMV